MPTAFRVRGGTACGFYTCNAGQCVVNQPPVVNAGPDQSISRTLVAPWTSTAFTLQTISTGWNYPIGIDYHPPSNSVILSVNYGQGLPYNLGAALLERRPPGSWNET